MMRHYWFQNYTLFLFQFNKQTMFENSWKTELSHQWTRRIFLWINQFDILDMGLTIALFIQYEVDRQNYTGLSNERVIAICTKIQNGSTDIVADCPAMSFVFVC